MYYNFIFIVSACNCSINGTLNGDNTCEQRTGQCTCKNTTHGLTCSTCRHGYYSFPQSPSEECLLCICDLGGSRIDYCHQSSGHYL